MSSCSPSQISTPVFKATELSTRVGFACNRLNRHSERREIEAELASMRANPQARAFLIVGETPLLKTVNMRERARFTFEEIAAIGSVQEIAYLGTLDGIPLFAILLPTSLEAVIEQRDDIELIGLRTIVNQGLLSADESGPLGEAKALMDWHRRHRFCANCGSATIAFTGGFRRDCPACHTQHFPRIDPVVIMLVTDGERYLLGRQSQFLPGVYSTLAGFIEPGETIEDAVRREVREEAGITVGEVRYLASQPWPFPSSLMIGCVACALSENIVIDKLELEDARWFSREEIQLMMIGKHPDGLIIPPPASISHHLIRSFVDQCYDKAEE